MKFCTYSVVDEAGRFLHVCAFSAILKYDVVIPAAFDAKARRLGALKERIGKKKIVMAYALLKNCSHLCSILKNNK